MPNRKPEHSRERALAILRAGADESSAAIARVADRLGGQLNTAAERIAGALGSGGHLWIFGNGGSAADAQHIAAELSGRYLREREGLPATALTTNSSALTAIGNDYGFESIFARQLEGVCRPADVSLGISTSGRSPNVVEALRTARRIGAFTIALTGEEGRDCAEMADLTIAIPASETPRIQECHIFVGHVLCEIVEDTLFLQS